MLSDGVRPPVADRALNHHSETISTVARIYNRFEYLDKRRDALQAWRRFVEALVHPETAQGKAVELRRAGT